MFLRLIPYIDLAKLVSAPIDFVTLVLTS
jgi:hypothetical protein